MQRHPVLFLMYISLRAICILCCINALNDSSLHWTFSNLEEVVFHMNDLLRRVTRKPVKYTGASTPQLYWS